jgi:SAM-dependent methyltransferase
VAKLRITKTESQQRQQERETSNVPPSPPGYLLQCAPGLAKVLQRELNFVGATTRDQKLFVKLQRNHDLIFANKVKSDLRLDELRTAEMVLKCPAYGRFKISQRQLGLMAETLSEIGSRRLVVSVAGKVFQRQDLARFLTKSMAERGYSFDEDIEDEVWMFCIDESWYFGLPLFKSRALREERSEEREGALPPTIAGAMAFASLPRPNDIVLDPCCGSGTLLAEFHTYARAARLVGRDIDPRAVKIAKSNLSSVTGAPLSEIEIAQADSRTEVAPEGVTLTLANLPFGVQFGDRASNPALYRDLIDASLKSATPDWRGLFLTSDTDSFAQAVRDLAVLTPEVMFKVKVRGEHATCFRLKKS